MEHLEIDLKSLNNELRAKFEKLLNWFRDIGGPVVVAFSGGVDSSVVLAAATLALGKNNVIAVTAVSPTYPEDDLHWAKKIASILDVKHVFVESNELQNPYFVANPPNRCYFCKKSLSKELKDVANKFNAKTIVDGTNFSDLATHRPGYLAFKEEGVRSPLAEVGITKDEARLLAKALGLPNWSKPPMACLASRIPYGEQITVEKLRRVAEAEKIVKNLAGVTIIRVRDHGHIARIEVGRDERRKFFNEELMDRIAQELQKLGYKYVTLDLLGYRSGSMDEVLSKKIIPLQKQ
ncbi:ATP-dependent sacrificial sulfur transferase LarE [Ignisphaera sp. 4213-co]|uniref:ATP-dependent sacrificial sulfur transferase LarE n=1 Tax=Ignisphaera cupida TaxID=3050454 RepID=A0ABD4Z4F2_9CREN|nr:ATP-dependent sacrificial sulfur transferase LarE [Ignisphaera sp. 4213-co]MDK6028079.1 ATP-dependent sacrificial sulfur transferase LarE [Ignisphaera sp. 4213-co]